MMPMTTQTVGAYLKATPPLARRYLKSIRAIARAAAPRATESISYRIPTLKIDGRPFLYYAAFRNHVSVFPMTGAIRREFAAELKDYKTSTGTVQFPLDKPLPVAFVRRLVKARLAEMRKNSR
jgi:uncharacterized protein YdhG (YjbR/CyaY superfamily)